MNHRPTGITLIGILFLIVGFLSLLWSGVVFGFAGLGAFFSGLFGAEEVSAASNAAGWSGFLGILAALVQIAVGFGMFSMQRWAWWLALLAVGLTVIQGLIGMLDGGLFGFLCASLGLIFPLLVLFYLLSGRIRQAFGIE